MSASTILCEVPPSTPDLCAEMWAGQGDPLYAVGSSWHKRRELASDLGLPWSTGEGERFYVALTPGEIWALRRAAREYRAAYDAEVRRAEEGGFDPDIREDGKQIYDCAGFFLGVALGEGPGWPADLSLDSEGEDLDTADMDQRIATHPEYGYVLAGERARARMARG